MDLVWQSSAKPRKLHSPRLGPSDSNPANGNSNYRKIVHWTPPTQLCPAGGFDVQSQAFGANEDASFRFSKFRLANPPGQSKRRRPDEYAERPPPAETMDSVLPPITNEQIADRPRRKRLTRAERVEKLAAQEAAVAAQKEALAASRPPPSPATPVPRHAPQHNYHPQQVPPRPRSTPADYGHYYTGRTTPTMSGSYHPVPPAPPVPSLPQRPYTPHPQNGYGNPPRRTRKELFA